jgi:hypothetical protein
VQVQRIEVNTLTLGFKAYELSNHLGNVLTIIADNVLPNVSPFSIDATARILHSQDYLPFGMAMTNRGYTEIGGRGYAFGFNTQRKDLDIDENGNHYTAEFWEYDGRIGRRWNIDPVRKDYESSYAVLSNSPISHTDILGDDDIFSTSGKFLIRTSKGNDIRVQTGSGAFVKVSELDLKDRSNRIILANIVGFYATLVGIDHQHSKKGNKGTVGISVTNSEASAFTRGQNIWVNIKDNKLHGGMENVWVMQMSLVHEDGHKKENKNPSKEARENPFSAHAHIYAMGFDTEHFSKIGDEALQIGYVNSALNFLHNAKVGGEKEDYVKSAEDNLSASLKKSGYLVQYQQIGMDAKGAVYNIFKEVKNKKGKTTYKKVGEVPYKKLKDAN